MGSWSLGSLNHKGLVRKRCGQWLWIFFSICHFLRGKLSSSPGFLCGCLEKLKGQPWKITQAEVELCFKTQRNSAYRGDQKHLWVTCLATGNCRLWRGKEKKIALKITPGEQLLLVKLRAFETYWWAELFPLCDVKHFVLLGGDVVFLSRVGFDFLAAQRVAAVVDAVSLFNDVIVVAGIQVEGRCPEPLQVWPLTQYFQFFHKKNPRTPLGDLPRQRKL